MTEDSYHLSRGSHPDGPRSGRCAMEWISHMVGDRHSDSVPCVSPVVRDVLIYCNDNLSDKPRQRLRPYLARAIGTADDGDDEARKPLREALSTIVGFPASAHALDPMADELFLPGGWLDQLLPLQPVPMPQLFELAPAPDPALFASSF